MNNMQASTTHRIVTAALLASLVCVTTMIVKIPSPLKGYLNLGDCAVLLTGWILSPMYAFLSAGIGSALADLFSGYVIYAPTTFAIKGIMAISAFYGFKLLHKKLGSMLSRTFGGIVAELIMISGYFIFEGILYGFGPSIVNIPANAVQGVVGLVLSLVLTKAIEKSSIILP